MGESGKGKHYRIILGGPSHQFSLQSLRPAGTPSMARGAIDAPSPASVLILNGPIVWHHSKRALSALSSSQAKHPSPSQSPQALLWASRWLFALSAAFNQPLRPPRPPSWRPGGACPLWNIPGTNLALDSSTRKQRRRLHRRQSRLSGTLLIA